MINHRLKDDLVLDVYLQVKNFIASLNLAVAVSFISLAKIIFTKFMMYILFLKKYPPSTLKVDRKFKNRSL